MVSKTHNNPDYAYSHLSQAEDTAKQLDTRIDIADEATLTSTAAAPRPSPTQAEQKQAKSTESDKKEAAQTISLVAVIGLTNIKAHAIAQTPEDAPPPSQTYTYSDFLARQVIMMRPTLRVEYENAGTVLTAGEKPDDPKAKEGAPSIITESTWSDIPLIIGDKLKGNDPQAYGPSVASRLNQLTGSMTRTCTKVGKLFFQGRLGRPTDNLEVITRRQDALKALIADDKLQVELAELLRAIGENEKHPASFWHRFTVMPGRSEGKYPKTNTGLDKLVNEHATLLDLHWAKEVLNTVTGIGTQGSNVPMMAMSTVDQTGVLPKEVSTFTEGYVSRVALQAGGIYTAALYSGSPVIKAVGAAFLAISNGWYLKNNLGYVWADLKTEALFHEKLLATSRTYKAMKAIHKALDKTVIASKLEHFQKLDAFLKNPELQSLFGKLESRTFNDSANWFFRRGNVLGAWRQMEQQDVKKAFAKAFLAIAEIDSVLATASIVKDSQSNQGPKFCFPEFINEQTADSNVEIVEGWNPLVAIDQAVTNTIHLGKKHNMPNLVITGANAGGKSTSIKMIMLVAIMGQSLGIAPARAVKTTVFNHIISAMQSKDNMGGGDSLFQAQVKTIIEIDAKLKAHPDKRMLVALDETFNSTQPTKGASLAQAAMQQLVSYRNNMLLFATHFLNVPRAAAKMKDEVVPIKFTKDASGKFAYKAELGIAEDRHAFTAAADLGLDSAMLKSAAAIEKTLTLADL